MKRKLIILTIYAIGVVVSWGIGWNMIHQWKDKAKIPMTYGDVAAVSFLSLFSWALVPVYGLIELMESDFLKTPINTK